VARRGAPAVRARRHAAARCTRTRCNSAARAGGRSGAVAARRGAARCRRTQRRRSKRSPGPVTRRGGDACMRGGCALLALS